MIGRNSSGFVCVLSAAHIFRSKSEAKIKLQDGTVYDAWVYDFDRATDVAILGAEVPLTKKLTCVPVASDQPEPQAEVIKIGFPSYANGQPNIRSGPVVKTMGGFLFNAKIIVRPGDSGGGVFQGGRLVSIVSGYTNGDTMWGTGTTAMQDMLTKKGWACRILPRIFPILPIRRGEPPHHPPPEKAPPSTPPKSLPPPDPIGEPAPKIPPPAPVQPIGTFQDKLDSFGKRLDALEARPVDQKLIIMMQQIIDRQEKIEKQVAGHAETLGKLSGSAIFPVPLPQPK